jgi:dihydrodipicolinate synthase/N-acetylneuraminate lyase
VDVKKTLEHIVNLHDAGAQGVVINGTTGDGHLISHAAKLLLIKAVGRLAREKRFRRDFALVTGTGTTDTGQALEIIRTARNQGFHGILALPPKGALEQKLRHFSALANACDSRDPRRKLGLFLYHHPGLKAFISPRLLGTLMQRHEVVLGLKDFEGKEGVLAGWNRQVMHFSGGRRPVILVGSDKLITRGLALGAAGAVFGAGNTANGLRAGLRVFRHYKARRFKKVRLAQGDLDDEVDKLLGGPSGADGFRDMARLNRLLPSH